MLVVLRAGTHLDFTPLQAQPGSRYGEAVATYYTLAWFDRYLRGRSDRTLARDALRRLRASAFDDSADRHAISTGTFDVRSGNRPHLIAGMPVCDRLSFYFRSRLSLTSPEGRRGIGSENLRRTCSINGRLDVG